MTDSLYSTTDPHAREYSSDVAIYLQEVDALSAKLGPPSSEAHRAWRGLVSLDQLLAGLSNGGANAHLGTLLSGPLGRLPKIRSSIEDYHRSGSGSLAPLRESLEGLRKEYIHYWNGRGVDVEEFAQAHNMG